MTTRNSLASRRRAVQNPCMGIAQYFNILAARLFPLTFPVAVIAICLPIFVIEAIMVLADTHILPWTRLRTLTYQNGAFWAGLLHNWRPNYEAQPWLMFLSYSILHTGPAHMLGNIIVLVLLGRDIILRIGQSAFLLLYFLSVIGGGVCFGLLTQSAQPMVGASGALFGLAAAFLLLEGTERRAQGMVTWPLWAFVPVLILLNLILWVATRGLLAWETHLGGFLAGIVFCAIRQVVILRRAQ